MLTRRTLIHAIVGLHAVSLVQTIQPVSDVFEPVFVAPQLTPLQFMFVSSPAEKKIVYTQMRNFKSRTGRSFALVDSGLSQPCGLAFDRNRGFLYVADREAQKIFRYTILVDDPKTGHHEDIGLVTDGVQLTILQNRPVEWVAVDQSGDVFYSDMGYNSINRIPFDVIDTLGNGERQAGELQLISEKTLEAITASEAQTELQNSDKAPLPTDAPFVNMQIFSVYESSVNPHVVAPAGLASDGYNLYWANSADGETAGTAVAGMVHPKPAALISAGSEPAPFPCTPLANNTDSAFGVAKSNTMVLYSANASGAGVVYGVMDSGGAVAPFATGLAAPRGLVWDGDQTVYVADVAGHAVYSFPVGRLVDGAPLAMALSLRGAFGVALLSEADSAYLNKNGAASGRAAGSWMRNVGLFAILAFVRAAAS